MKKYSLFALFLSLLTVMTVTSCKDTDDYVGGIASGMQVYFDKDMNPTVELPSDQNTFTIPIKRVDTSSQATVPLNIVCTPVISGESTMSFSCPTSVTFAQGESTANIVVGYNPEEIQYDHYDYLDMKISDGTYTTPYGLSEVTLMVGTPAPWTSLGVATVTDDFFTTFFGVDNVSWPVEIQENDMTPGFYRLVNPYNTLNYPYNEDGDFDASNDYYIYIHAEDPTKVWIEQADLGVNWGYGNFGVWGLAGYYMDRQGLSLDEVAAAGYCGTLANGEITFPASSLLISMADYNEGSWYTANDSGLFSILFPGASKKDLSSAVTYSGIFTNTESQPFAVAELTLGADVTNALAIVVPADADADAVADALASGEVEGTPVSGGRIEVPIGDQTGKLQIVVVVIEDGAVKSVASSAFEYYGGGANPWESIGTGLYTEAFITTLFGPEPVTYEVEIEENTETPGLYRMVNPYGAAFPINEEGDYDPNATFNIEVDAQDPDGVVIFEQSTGLDYGYGVMSIVTKGGYYATTYDLPTLKEHGYLGTNKDGVITFPVFNYTSEDGATSIDYQGYTSMGGKMYYSGTATQIILPSAVTASAKKKAAATRKALEFEKRLKGNKITMMPLVSKKMLKNAQMKFAK